MIYLQALAATALAVGLGVLVVWVGVEVAYRLHVRRELHRFDRYVTAWRARN